MKIIKQISKAQIEKLLKDGVIRNTHRGYVKANGEHVGYYKTCGGQRYIEDYYVNLFNKQVFTYAYTERL